MRKSLGHRSRSSTSLAARYGFVFRSIAFIVRLAAGPPKVIGIDEHFFSLRNGFTEFATVFTDLKKKRLMEMCLGKDKKSIIEQVQHIPGRFDFQIVVIDMSNGYRSFVKEFFPNAMIVADKFHMLRLITPVLLKVRKEIHGHKQDLQQRRLLLRNRENLDYFVRSDIDKYLSQHPELNELYRIKEITCERKHIQYNHF